jgi:hypothetical protein
MINGRFSHKHHPPTMRAQSKGVQSTRKLLPLSFWTPWGAIGGIFDGIVC